MSQWPPPSVSRANAVEEVDSPAAAAEDAPNNSSNFAGDSCLENSVENITRRLSVSSDLEASEQLGKAQFIDKRRAFACGSSAEALKGSLLSHIESETCVLQTIQQIVSI